jgi:MFS family permease
MTSHSDRWTLVFSSLGHALVHMLTAFFFIVVLALETEWNRPYHELIELWTLGALLVGLCALPAGWLADRWSAPGMMVIMFFGMGASCLYCAGVDSPSEMLVGLAGLGVFASIYHPVGVPWIVRNSAAKGRALGINGIFGGFGVALAGAVSGLLIDLVGWRAVFALPGLASIVSGLALAYCVQTGRIEEANLATGKDSRRGEGGMLRGFLLLLLTMFCLGFVFQTSQVAFPKLFDVRLDEWLGQGTLGVGLAVSGVYALGSLVQLLGGHLADRFPLKPVYLIIVMLQAPILLAVAVSFGLPLLASATVAVMLSSAALPAENLLLARYSPRRHQSLAFGIKFVLAFGTAPLAIRFVSRVNATTGEFTWVFLVLGALSVIACAVAAALPRERSSAAESAVA